MNILLIGVGYHARRIYVPFFFEKNPPARLVAGVDIVSQKGIIGAYLAEKKYALPIHYLESEDDWEVVLDALVKKHGITAVIISTEPTSHFRYASWALRRGLHILMDKPVTTEKNVVTETNKASKLRKDFEALKELYLPLRKKGVVFSLMAQRRFHPAYQFIRDHIREVFADTNCPVTSIQAFHCDGQWRLPTEIVEQDYHPYNQGYGKLSHSGYHIIDMVVWFIQAAQSAEKQITSADIYTKFLLPTDFNYQVSMDDHQKVIPDFYIYNKFSDAEFVERAKRFGEMDAFSTISFNARGRVSCLASINMGHNGFSQRNWPTAHGRDLYKGNGRVRQEQYFIEQGPFQSISLLTYQSKEIKEERSNLYSVGGEHHLEVHVFRNSKLFPQWQNYERFSLENIKDLGYQRGHQEDARRTGIVDFIHSAQTGGKSKSDFLDHETGTRLLSAMYLSHIRNARHQNPLVHIDLREADFKLERDLKQYIDVLKDSFTHSLNHA